MNVVWFRNDLRVDDNPALYHASCDGAKPLIALYYLCQEQWDQHNMGRNQKALILQALKNLGLQLKNYNIPLFIINAGTFAEIPTRLLLLTQLLKVSNLYFNVEYPANERRRDKLVVDILKNQVECHRYVGQSLIPPWKIVNGQGEGYKVFTAYARQVHRQLDLEPVDCVPDPIKQSQSNFKQHNTISTDPVPGIRPTATEIPEIAEDKLQLQLNQFQEQQMAYYTDQRDFPSIAGTSQLSSALAVGAISVRRCYLSAKQASTDEASAWIKQLIWRDFYRSIMWHYPKVSRNQGFVTYESQLPWAKSPHKLNSWKNGETGIPIIDAAMQQLRQTGWMHNRLRMVVASFLTKNLWLDWREGEKFFAQHLFDFDYANNNGGWQWCASVGTDAAPYFRVFNPLSQQKRFDENTEFIKYWLPSLRDFTAKQLHSVDIKPIPGYCRPLVDLKRTRQEAIDQFKFAKTGS